MRRTTIALLAALEASVAALIGLGVVVVPLILVWAIHFGLAIDVTVLLRAAADVWLLGHGVDLTVQLDPVTAARVALPGAGDPFQLTIALLGFALLSVAFGRRIGRRATAAGHPFIGGAAATLVYATLGAVLAVVAGVDAARADPWRAALLCAFAMALGVVIGAAFESLRRVSTASTRADAAAGVTGRVLVALPPALVTGARAAVRVGAGAAFGVLALAAVLVAVLIAVDYATIAGLYQALGAGVDGGIALTVAELALLPNVIVWAAAWLLGPGFAVGSDTLVATGGTLLGPVPGLPLLGALPADAPALGTLWLAVPVLLGFAGAWFVSAPPATARARAGEKTPWWAPTVTGIGAAAVAALVLGVLAWWSGGAAGPGRLADVGPDPWAVAGVAAATVGIGALVGGHASWTRSRPRSAHDIPVLREEPAAVRREEPAAVSHEEAAGAEPATAEPEAAHREFIWGRSGGRER